MPKKNLGMYSVYQNFDLFYLLVLGLGCMKPDIALNLNLANIRVMEC